MTTRVPYLALLSLAGCAGLTARPIAVAFERALPPLRFTLSGAAVAIYDPAGEVRIEAGAGPDVVVTVTRAGGDAAALSALRESRSSGTVLQVLASGPGAHRLYYPGLPGRSDSVVFRVTAGGLKAGKGGFLGLFAGRATTVVRRPGAGGLDAHADLLVTVPPGRRLDLQLGAGRLVVTGAAGDIRALTLGGSTQATGSGGRLRLTAASGGISVSGASGALTLESAAGPVEVNGFHGRSLSATTGAGGVGGADLTADTLQVRTGAGDVVLRRVRARRLALRTGAGALRVDDVRADTLLARAGVGALALRGVRAGAAVIEARKGDVRLGLLEVPASLRLRADGAAALALPPGADADLALKSDHGRFVIAAPVAGRSGAGQHLFLRLGRGGPRLVVTAEHDLTVEEETAGATAAAGLRAR